MFPESGFGDSGGKWGTLSRLTLPERRRVGGSAWRPGPWKEAEGGPRGHRLEGGRATAPGRGLDPRPELCVQECLLNEPTDQGLSSQPLLWTFLQHKGSYESF